MKENKKAKKSVAIENNGIGETSISIEAIKQMAGSVAMECFGIVGMASVSMKDGLVRLLKRDSMTKGVEIEITEGEIYVSFHVVVAYGVSIVAVSTNLIENVSYKLEEFTGMKVRHVAIYVEGVRPVD